MGQYEREEEQLERELSNGDISVKEYNEQMRDMQRSYREEAQDAAQNAYDNELSNW
jgi:hypothetical protein